jgi:hypothetical protein
VSAQKWFEKVRNAAVWINENGERRGDILFIVHGYNMSEGESFSAIAASLMTW